MEADKKTTPGLENDWELSEEYYKEDGEKREFKLEDFIEEDSADQASGADAGDNSINAEVQRIAAEVHQVVELSMGGKTIPEIAQILGTEEQYIRDIEACVQSFPEDSETAVAHLIMMG